MTRRILVPLLALTLLVPAATASAAPAGALSDISGSGGCATNDGSGDAGLGTCLADASLDEPASPDSTAVAPDGRFVYVADEGGRLVMYARDATTGALSIPSGVRCWDEASAGGCADYSGRIIGDGDTIVISGDGRFLYATDDSAHPGIVVFSRDSATGVLSQLAGTAGCLSVDGAGEGGPGQCADIRGTDAPNAIRLSPDERFVYLTDYGNIGSVLTFARNTATGVLSQLAGLDGCISSTGASEDGPATCQNGRLVSDDRALTVTRDGRHAVAADFNQNGVELFDRDPATGVLTVRTDAASCITQTGTAEAVPGACLDGRALGQAYQVAAGVDGRTLYVSTEAPGGITVLRLDPATGTLSQPAGADGCITPTGNDGDAGTTCRAAAGVSASYGVALSPDGRTLYGLGRSDRLTIYSIDSATGLPTPLPAPSVCIAEDGKDGTGVSGTCVNGKAFRGAYSIAFSPNGANAYVTNRSVSAFRREVLPVCTSASAATPFQTPIALGLTCSDANGDALTRQVSAGPAGGALGPIDASGGALFTPAAGFSGAASFSFTATDASGTSDPATATVTVGAGPPAQPAAAGDRTKPAVRVTKARLTAKGIMLTLSLSEAAQVKAALKGRLGKARKAKTLATGTASAERAGTFTLVLRPAKASRKALLGLRGKRLKRFRGALSVTATDIAKNRGTASVKALKLAR